MGKEFFLWDLMFQPTFLGGLGQFLLVTAISNGHLCESNSSTVLLVFLSDFICLFAS